MRRLVILLSAIVFLSGLTITGCEKPEVKPEGPKQPEGFIELLQAYNEGKVFQSAVRQGEVCILTFTDGYKLTITAFHIYDCTEKSPAKVEAVGNWWTINGSMLGIEADSSVPDLESVPVYVYYDAKTLYAYLSNRKHLVFPSKVLEDEKEHQKEMERRQNIPVIHIKTKNSAPILNKKDYVDGTITISDPEKLYSDVAEFSAEMGIRGRGNSTWSFPKKPWKVKLKEKASLLGMPADKEWALLANYADRTLVRNIVAMKLSEICGFSWTPRMHSVEVYLNGKYQGVYTLCEHKKVSSDRVDIDVVGEDVTGGDAITGGYYLEIEEQQDETTCWWTSMGVPMMFSDPEEPNSEQLAYVKGLFESFEQALWAKDYSQTSGYPKYIDVDSFVDYYIVQELTKNIDGNLRKSSFITKERGKKMEMYHLWDFDLTLGNCGYFWGNVGNGPDNFWIKLDKWYPHLFADPAFVDKVQKRWNELKPEFDKIPEFIDEQTFYLAKAQERNFKVWSIWESVDWVYFPSLGSYEKEVDYLKEFYTKRLEWLDTELNKL
ncbi:MAG: CotH kinase family protein [Bacteroidales bacterium]|nr:CotH kinase family protein [Bacteroidales bacterium]MBO5075910.1 CotH kinase family protein [Bacteroidales bacterium]